MGTAIRQSGNRDTAVDFWRGVALATIFVNHVAGNVLEQFTHKNFGLSDAADLFVLLAGFAAAQAYVVRYVPGQRLDVADKVARRVVLL
ncbi:MAG: OpgC domain-containing protein, partial [Rhodospirillales bacterium]